MKNYLILYSMGKKRKIILPFYTKIVSRISGYGLKQYYPIRKINHFVKSQIKTQFAVVQGSKMFLDPKDNLSLSIFGVYEPLETEVVKKAIKKNDLVVDVGAFIGYYTLLFARLVGSKGKVVSFEPNHKSFVILEKNVKLNKLQNIILEEKIVSDHKDSSITNEISFDDYFKNVEQKIDFIKIDIEGAEAQALKGMKNVLENNTKIKILTEFHPLQLKKFGTEPEDYLKLLSDFGFSIYHINNRDKKIIKTSHKKLLDYYPTKDSSTNLFCKRE